MANLRTFTYQGFNNAMGSEATGSGIIFWSGSMQLPLTNTVSNTQYYGVGIEAIAHSGSYLRFRTDIDGAGGGSELDIKTNKFFLGSDSAFISGSGDGTIAISSSNFELDESGAVVMQGTITAEAGGTIGGFDITDKAISSPNLALILSGSGQITASAADIGGWKFNSSRMLYGAAGGGIWMGQANHDAGQTEIRISSDGAGTGTTNYTRLYIDNDADTWGIEGKSGGLTVFHLGETVGADNNQIAGWTFDNEKLTGGKLVLDKVGKIYSEGFQSSPLPLGGTGFLLTVDDGTGASFLEVENARIRGTLSTAVFEKETVNAVGGQLLVSNSTTLKTGSVVTPTQTTMSVMNVTGFTAGEILLAKKVSDTGFNTEYLYVESASRTGSGDNEYEGELYVQRGYGFGGSGPASNLPGAVGGATSYSGSQVIVSTGKVNTGFIHLNANPNDIFTPYIDIVERTGSGLYDAVKVARLGDLSGIEDNNFTDGVTGYGLYTGNGYFKGKLEIGSVPNQPPIDRLWTHYNFTQATSSGDIIDQSPNRYTGSLQSIGNGYNLNIPGGITGSSYYMSVSRSYFEVFTEQPNGTNKFSAAYRFKFDGPISKNTFIAKGHGSFILYRQTDNSIEWRVNTGASSPSYKTVKTLGGTIEARKEYHAFCTVEEGVKSQIYLYQTDSGSSGKPVLISHVTASWASFPRYYFIEPSSPATYRNVEHGRQGWGTAGTNRPFSGSFYDIRYYNQHVLTEAECHAIALNPDAGVAGTVIDGDSVTTGKIESNLLGTDTGTQLDLDEGIMKIGGTGAYTNNNGILMNGPLAQFAVGNLSTNYIRFNHTANKIEIETPGVKIDANGFLQAVNFAEKMTSVNASNVSQYFSNGKLLFDGSGGGEVTMNIALRVNPGVIKGVVLPISSSDLAAGANVFPKVHGIRYDDGLVTATSDRDSHYASEADGA